MWKRLFRLTILENNLEKSASRLIREGDGGKSVSGYIPCDIHVQIELGNLLYNSGGVECI